MPFQTKRIEFADERDRLRGELEDAAEKQVTWEERALDGNEIAQQHVQQQAFRANRLQNQIQALEWAEAQWDVGGIELAGLTAGEVNRAEDTVDEITEARERDVWVALGTRNAPYLEHDPDEIRQEDLDRTIVNVFDLPLAFVRWAESRISDLSHLGGDEGNAYGELLQEKRNKNR